MEPVSFIILGEPEGKGRPRFCRNGRTYTPKKTSDYEKRVKAALLEFNPDCKPWEKGIPLKVRVMAFYGIPVSASKKKREEMISGSIRPTKKPDCDNALKILLDPLNGILWYDDAQVVDARLVKYYSVTPRVEIEVMEAKL